MNILPFGRSRPFFDNTKCLNKIQRKYPCTVCTEICPRGVFSLNPKEPTQWDRCTDCGLCIAACPSRCFAPSSERQKRTAEDLNLNLPVSFGCSMEETLCTVHAGCLAAVPWELIAACALYTDVVLYTGVCENCREEKKKQAVSAQIETIRRFLGEKRFSARVHMLKEGSFKGPEEEKREEKAVSRREIFAGIGRQMKKQAYKAAFRRLPFLENAEENGMQYRMLLAKAMQEESRNDPEYRAGVSLPQYTVSCTGCGICEKLCPQKAIEIGREEDGKRMIWITPWKCTACGICAKACPFDGLAGMHTVSVPRMTRIPLVRINAKGDKCDE